MTVRYKVSLEGSLGLSDSIHRRTNGGGFRCIGAGVAQPIEVREIYWFVQTRIGLELVDEQ